MNTLQDLIKKYAAQYKEQVIAWRRHIHSHPELSGQEKETSLFIQKILDELHIPYVNDVSDYAVIGEIQGAHTGPVIALRADIDALPIHERRVYLLHHKTKVLCMLADTMDIYRFCLVRQLCCNLLKMNCTVPLNSYSNLLKKRRYFLVHKALWTAVS